MSVHHTVGKMTDAHSNNPHHQQLQPTLQKTCILPGGALLKGRDGQDSRATELPETKFSK